MSKRNIEYNSNSSNKKQKTKEADEFVQDILQINERINELICKNSIINNMLNDLLKDNRKLIDSMCDHDWVVDYEGCWGPSDRTPKICSKCGL